uniref:Tumor protein p53-inducible protein 11 n=1 Tax=Schistosoma mansoni TaxID=6183 RepID=A0A5K4EY98_SCHMA
MSFLQRTTITIFINFGIPKTLRLPNVTQLLGDSNEVKLDIQDIPCIHCWNYLMASLILFFGLLLVGFPIPHSDWFLQSLFPISDNYDNPISTESCNIPRAFNIQYIYMHLGCLHLVIASGMLYSLSMIKMNGIHVSQLLSSAYSVTFVAVHLLTKQLNWIVYLYTVLTIITIIFHVKLSKIQVKGWILPVKQYFLTKLSTQNTYYSSNDATK